MGYGLIRLYIGPGFAYKWGNVHGGDPNEGENHGTQEEGYEKTQEGQRHLTHETTPPTSRSTAIFKRTHFDTCRTIPNLGPLFCNGGLFLSDACGYIQTDR
jgi:hypothetical protein